MRVTGSTTLPTSITAMRVHQFGSPEVIAFDRIDRPRPGAYDVLVRVCAAGVGPWDAWIRAGKSVLPQPLPLTLGSDLSGVVVETGSSVTGFRVGDPVFGVTNHRFTGAYADYAIADAGMIALKPPRLDDVDAASVPVVAVTAWQALFDHARLIAGQKVLILGAAGNVGAFAVQMARNAGVTVVATAGTADVHYVRRLGADTVIDYQTTRPEGAVTDLDAVIDLVGGVVQMQALGALKRGGIMVSAVSEPDQARAAAFGLTARFFLVEITTQILAQIGGMLEQGMLRTEVGAIFPLAGARIAHEMLDGQRPRPRGKIVLRVGC